MYKPFVIEIPSNNNDIKKYKSDIIISSTIARPLFTLGFHHFQHRTKSAMNITKDLETKKNFYNIVNTFDSDNININKNDIISQNYYKLWEILCLFDITSKNKLNTCIIGSGSGGFVQSYIDFRDKYYTVKDDKIFTVTTKPEDNSIRDLNKTYMGKIKKDYKKLIIQHKTSKHEVAIKYTGKDNGNIRDFKTIKNFKKDLQKEKVLSDLVLCNANHKYIDNNYKEQESYQLLFGEIVAMLNIIKKNGNFVLRIYETYTMITIKLLYFLSSLFENIYIFKPFTSYENTEEKYIICKNFKYNQKDLELKEYQLMLEKMDTDIFIGDIFSNMSIPDEYINIIKFININISNKQQIIINKMVTFIKSNNYFGNEYHEYKNNQEKAHEFWIKTFINDDLPKLIGDQIKYNKSEIKLFSQSLVN
jgi:23S rRNA U2552 (ribose-2'-O)-methylase RlmE/FtsJ